MPEIVRLWTRDALVEKTNSYTRFCSLHNPTNFDIGIDGGLPLTLSMALPFAGAGAAVTGKKTSTTDTRGGEWGYASEDHPTN